MTDGPGSDVTVVKGGMVPDKQQKYNRPLLR